MEAESLIVDAFRRFDANGDGVISRKELSDVFRSLDQVNFDEHRIDMLMQAADVNQDGKIQYEEFIAWLMQCVDVPLRPPIAVSSASGISPVSSIGDMSVYDKCPMDRRGAMPVGSLHFLPERFDVDIAKRYSLDSQAIGTGQFGSVFVAADREFAGRRVAVKQIAIAEDKCVQKSLFNEIEIMKELDHPNICKLLGTFEYGKQMYLIMELLEGRTLLEHIVLVGCVGERLSAEIVGQLASALAYAHGRAIAHRDVKPENVMFCSEIREYTHVKLIDWGCGEKFLGSPMTSSTGSFSYAAPEVILASGPENSYTATCDLWSLGVLTYVTLCGSPPFWGSHRRHLRKAKAEEYPMKATPWPGTSADAKDFIARLLKAHPSARLSATEAVAHPWLAKQPRQECKQEHARMVLANLKHFSNASSFAKLCIMAVARQLDHRHLRSIHQVFQEMDDDGDGVLSILEVTDGLRKLIGEDSEELYEIAALFKGMDLDDSDSIEYTEFCAASLGQKMLTQDDQLWAAFKAFDRQNTGWIDKDDIKHMLGAADVRRIWTTELCNEVAGELLAAHDVTGDQRISFDEWKRLMGSFWQRYVSPGDARKDSNSELVPVAYEFLVRVSELPPLKSADAHPP